ncbi:MAG: LLM class flavin-dependent oxidoreductase [Pseudomonadota bacterium]
MQHIEFGWFLPTSGDTTAYGVEEASMKIDPAYLTGVVEAAESAGFEYLLIPVDQLCWEAYIAGAFVTAATRSIKPLIAARPGYINPVLLAKMISTFDQFTGGRIAVNLIAGQAEGEIVAEGIQYAKEDRYALMNEEVTILKALWGATEPLHFEGRFHQLNGASITPKPVQQPYPRFYLGGGSAEAWALSARHSDVHLFWGDTPERIAANMTEIRALAATFPERKTPIEFGMRLQIICRETEDEALDAAEQLICNVPEAERERLKRATYNSEANRRVQQLVAEKGLWIAPHLWSGLTRFRRGAGIAVVGDPQQCADTLQQFIDIGCTSFCLSGYLHHEEAERFGRLVRPLLIERNGERMQAA